MITMKQLSERLGCSLANCYALKDRGLIQVVCVGAGGSGFRVTEEEYQRFITAQRNERRQRTHEWPEKCKPVRLKHLT